MPTDHKAGELGGYSKESKSYCFYELLFSLFLLISVLDITSVSIAGVNLRWAWFVLPLLIFTLPKSLDHRSTFYFTLALFLIHIVSAVVSEFPFKGIIYSFWILVNYLLFFRAGYCLTKKLKQRVWLVMLWAGRVQIVLSICFVLLKLHERAQFTYYEPSYLAIGLIPYVFTVIFWTKKKLLDFSLLFALVLFNQSANMMLIILLSAIYWLIVNRKIWVALVFLLVFLLSLYAFYRLALMSPGNPNHSVAVWFSENGITFELITTILSRAGNRVPRILAAIEMLRDNWLTGFGGGEYADITLSINFDHITGGLSYLDPAGLPAVNVLLDAMTNAGIGAPLLIITWGSMLLYQFIHIKDKFEKYLIVGASVVIFIILQIESNYLRAYLWVFLGVFVARSRSHFLVKD